MMANWVGSARVTTSGLTFKTSRDSTRTGSRSPSWRPLLVWMSGLTSAPAWMEAQVSLSDSSPWTDDTSDFRLGASWLVLRP